MFIKLEIKKIIMSWSYFWPVDEQIYSVHGSEFIIFSSMFKFVYNQFPGFNEKSNNSCAIFLKL